MSERERRDIDRIDEQLSAYLDGEVTDAERRDVEAILEADPVRRAALRELDETRALVRDLPWVELTAGELEHLIAAVAATPELAPVVAIDSRRKGRVASWVAVGSVAAAIAIAIMLPTSEQQVTPAVATLNEAHSAQASATSGDPLPALAAMSVPVRFGR